MSNSVQKASEDVERHVRVGEVTNNVIKYSVVPKSDSYDSRKDFIETAVRNQITSLSSLCTGGEEGRLLINLLNNISNFSELHPDLPTEASLKTENVLDYKVTIEIPERTAGQMTDIKDRTGINHSKIIRRCIVKQLFTISLQSGLLKDWEEREVVKTWASLKNDMLALRSKFHEILYRLFVMGGPTTRMLLEQEQGSFQDFAEEYHDDFYESPIYEEMKEEFGPRAFNDLENMIEEIIGLEFEPKESDDSADSENPFLSEQA